MKNLKKKWTWQPKAVYEHRKIKENLKNLQAECIECNCLEELDKTICKLVIEYDSKVRGIFAKLFQIGLKVKQLVNLNSFNGLDYLFSLFSQFWIRKQSEIRSFRGLIGKLKTWRMRKLVRNKSQKLWPTLYWKQKKLGTKIQKKKTKKMSLIR